MLEKSRKEAITHHQQHCVNRDVHRLIEARFLKFLLKINRGQSFNVNIRVRDLTSCILLNVSAPLYGGNVFLSVKETLGSARARPCDPAELSDLS